MSRRISLRRWQQTALQKFEDSGRRDFLAVATPGAGKTTFALTACVRALQDRRAGRVIVVAPTQHLKHQWADAATAFGLSLEPEWASSDGALPSDMHGVVVTYQQVAASPRALRPLAHKAFAILDEIHHAAESRAWGDGIRFALGESAYRLSLSGTPFRTDQNAIPFVRYQGDDAEPDFEYGYADALADGRVVRPVYFPRIGGQMEWTSPDGTAYSHGFEDTLGTTLASQRLRTALSEKNEWLPSVLQRAHTQLLHLRRVDPRAGAMAIAMDQDHARCIARILRERVQACAIVATSDDPNASNKIAEFARSDAPWIVAVRMVSEGVDIPRLRVGVYATHTLTDLFFRQAVGRLVRWSAGAAKQNAYLFIPDDPRIRSFADNIKRERRHSLRKPESDDEHSPPDAEESAGQSEPEEKQLSLFTVISAVPTDERGRPLRTDDVILEDAEDDDDAVAAAEAFAAASMELPTIDASFAPEPVPVVPLVRAPDLESKRSPLAELAHLTPRQQRKQLRAWNTERAQELSRRAGMTHAEVNAELNRRTGIRRVSEATLPQLERRLQFANTWLKQLSDRARQMSRG